MKQKLEEANLNQSGAGVVCGGKLHANRAENVAFLDFMFQRRRLTF